ncbi:S8 family serine peptidase [Deinococcus detaillensis]|uniref:S8 family serine peptidase n=1 Tax=Deinococcus detaillensis TaxID=2592048 RepID=A0A553UKG8_9DEIO|nr:S8 family serine peptidase [Deinococcus detaillensis]TSA80541.1 S8 family serine peptidase [Deinococcus detaillensis]
MELLLRENPQYVIVFESATGDNETVLARVLNVAELAGPAAQGRTSRTILQQRNGVHARVYSRLAVAVANLTPQQVDELLAAPEVRTVARNQRRHLPPLVLPDSVGQSALLTGTLPASSPVNRALEQIGLDPARQTVTGKNIKVAVIDTGLDLTHPDFAVLPGNSQSFVPGEPDVQDQNGHGTHCAGVIAGKAVSAGGFRYSVAPDTELLIAKVLDQYGHGYDDQILDAIDWATDQGADILSMSLGSARQVGQPYSDPYERVASTLLSQGILLIAAAGNESQRPALIAPVGNPAACPSILAVAAVDGRDQPAFFSCGAVDAVGSVEVAAPGVGVYSAWVGGGYKRISGTSMATPHVAGVAALYMQQFPELSGQTLWDSLKQHARQVAAPATDVGAGVVQVPPPQV